MMTRNNLADIVARNRERPNEDVTALLAEVQELKTRQTTAMGWIARDVAPKLWEVRRSLLYQKPCPREYLVLDTAIALLDGHLAWLGPWNSAATKG